VSEIVKSTLGCAFGHRYVIINVRDLRKPCLENVRAVTRVLANVYAFFFLRLLNSYNLARRCMILAY
jgi:hypothetical protein